MPFRVLFVHSGANVYRTEWEIACTSQTSHKDSAFKVRSTFSLLTYDLTDSRHN